MKWILLKAGLVSTGAWLIVYLMVLIIIPLLGEPINPSAWILGFICPYLIGMPVTGFCFWQADRLKKVHAELIAAHAELREKASRDHMTGMLNRETFFGRLEKRRRRSDEGVLVILDADHFKRINDRFGHLNGDQALLLIADAIQRTVRDKDLAGRIGGEEFGVFLSGAGLSEAAIASERIRQAVEAIDFRTSCGSKVPLTISIGGAPAEASDNISELMRQADRCLYDAKRTGRNRVVFAAPMPQAA